MNTRFWKEDWFAELAITGEGHSYAHQRNIAHRDIKLANIMYEPETDSIKITDFGIARITDSSKTKAGTIPVTPADRSPEQLASQKVDGQPDFNSSGVRLISYLPAPYPSRPIRWQAQCLKLPMKRRRISDPCAPILRMRSLR